MPTERTRVGSGGRPVVCSLLSSAVLTVTGCYGANGYNSPHTLEPGRANLTVAPEAMRLERTVPASSYEARQLPNSIDPFGVRHQASEGFNLVPTIIGRIGVANGADLGFGIGGLTTLRADLKVRVAEGVVNAAFDPGYQIGFGLAGLADLPLLLGMDIGKRLEVVLSPGVAIASAPRHFLEVGENAVTPDGVMGRIGIGVRLHLADDFTLEPEFTVMKSPWGEQLTWYTAGLGFIVGSRPGPSSGTRGP